MPELIPAAPGSPGLTFDCCDHCEHTSNHGLPHDTPCDHGCNDYELEVIEDA